jgi:hypothetical protein
MEGGEEIIISNEEVIVSNEDNAENKEDDNLEMEGGEEIIISNEEVIVSNEDNEEKEEGKTVLRAKKKKRKYNDYNYNNNNYNKNTQSKTYNQTNNNYNNKGTQKKVIQKKDLIYDPNYDYKSNYFYQNISDSDWAKIKSFLNDSFSGQIPSETQLKNFFDGYPKIKKGNIEKLQEILDNVASQKKNFGAYQRIMQFFLKEYYKPKPSICEVYFFPNAKNEKHLIEMLRTCMKSLDIAIFSLTRDNFAKAVIEVFNRGIKVRVIADDECVKNFGSDVYKLAAAGISCKTDNSAQYHMHNKYAIIDESVIVTGSFNWTSQAISNNQENLLFYQDKDIAQQYTNEFNNLWNSFSTVIDKETALKQIEIEKNKKTNQNKAQK